MENIICTCCGLSKSVDNYYLIGSGRYRKQCKSCISNARKKYYRNNIKKIIEYQLRYKKENRDKRVEFMREYNKRQEVCIRMKQYRINNSKNLQQKCLEWRKNNPEKARAIDIRKRKKRAQNPVIRIRSNVSRAIGLALNRKGASKAGNSIMNFLPYSLKQLKEHLESMFEPWMTWQNYGMYIASKWSDNDSKTWTWQIDHIIPQSETPYDSMEHPNFIKCWQLSNIRPLSSKNNCLDGCNRIRHKKER